MDFAFTFDFDQFESIEQLTAQRQRRRSSLPPRIQSSWDSCQRSLKDHNIYTTQVSKTDHVSFSLTDATLDYLKSKSKLVAVLAALVSREPVGEGSLEAELDGQDDMGKLLTEEQVEIRNFRHRMIRTEFPELYRHIHLQVLPMEMCTSQNISKCKDVLKPLMMSTLSECFRTCLLSSAEHNQYYIMAKEIIRYLLDQRRWDELVNMLNDIPETTIQNHCDLVTLRDFILCCLAQNEGIKNNVSESWQHLLQISDPMTKLRAILGSLTLWSIDVCQYLLQNCLHIHLANSQLRKAVNRKLEEVQVYEKVNRTFQSFIYS